MAAKVLVNLGVELEAVRQAVEDEIAPGDRPATGDIGMTQRARRVVELAVDEARRQGHQYVGQAREQTMAIIGGKGSETRDGVLTCRLGAAELGAIDVLIEAGIRSTRSDAASWLIRAGIESHQELFQRVSATAAEIRRLRQEAQTIARGAVTDDPPPNEAR